MFRLNLIVLARRLSLLGIAGIFLPTLSFADEVMTIVGGRVGIGQSVPVVPLEVVAAPAAIGVGNAAITLRNAGAHAFQLDDTNVAGFWNFANANNESEFRISRSGTGNVEMKLTSAGNLTISGQLVTGARPARVAAIGFSTRITTCRR